MCAGAKLSIVALFGFALCQPAHGAQKQLKISSYNQAQWTQSKSDNAISSMNALASGAGCPSATFVRKGPDTPFDTNWPLVLNSTADMNKLQNGGRSIYVAQSINYCNGAAPAGGVIRGCARSGGPIVVTPIQKAGQLWLHELGHAQGLPHKAGAGSIMSAMLTSSSLALDANECAEIASPQAFPATEGGEPLDIADVQPRYANDPQKKYSELELFISSVWEKGLDDESISSRVKLLTRQELGIIFGYLTDDSAKEFWPNSVLVVASRATEANAQTILNAFSRIEKMPDDGDDGYVTIAKKNISIAKGFLVAASKNSVVVGDLEGETARIGQSPQGRSAEETADLQTKCILNATAWAIAGPSYREQYQKAKENCMNLLPPEGRDATDDGPFQKLDGLSGRSSGTSTLDAIQSPR